MKKIISAFFALFATYACAAPTQSVQWGYDPSVQSKIQFKYGSTWYPSLASCGLNLTYSLDSNGSLVCSSGYLLTPTVDNTQFASTNYDAFPQVYRLPSGKMVVFYFSSASGGHPGAGSAGTVAMRTSTDEGKTWSSQSVIAQNPSYLWDFGAAGITKTGRIIVAWGEFNLSTGGFLGNRYMYSDNEGATWTTPIAIPGVYGMPYGQIIPVDNNKIAIGTYGAKAVKFSLSADNGVTWPESYFVPSNANYQSSTYNISGITGSGSTATVSFTGTYQFKVGSNILISNAAPYNGVYAVTNAVSGSPTSTVQFASTETATVGTTGTVVAETFSEGSFAYLGGGNIVGLLRQENLNFSPYMVQVVSNDNGVTWTNQGSATFNYVAVPGPAWLTTYFGTDGSVIVKNTYQDRNVSVLKIRSVEAKGSSLLSGPSAWSQATRTDLGSISTSRSGYPSFVHACSTCSWGLGFYYDEDPLNPNTYATLKSFVTPSNPPILAQNFGNLGVNSAPPNGDFITESGGIISGGSANIGIQNIQSFASVKIGATSDGTPAIQGFGTSTNASRALKLNPFYNGVSIGKGLAINSDELSPSGTVISALGVGGTVDIGSNGSYGRITLGVQTGGYTAIQSWASSASPVTPTARSLVVNPYGSDVLIGDSASPAFHYYSSGTQKIEISNPTVFGDSIVSNGNSPTFGGTCSTNTYLGGQMSGSFKLAGACATNTTISLTFTYVTSNGYTCVLQNLTRPTSKLPQYSYNTNIARFVTSDVAGQSGDLVTYQCTGF